MLSKVLQVVMFTSQGLTPILLIDAEECFSEIINSFRSLEGVANEHGPKKSFVEQFMMGNIRRTYVSFISFHA